MRQDAERCVSSTTSLLPAALAALVAALEPDSYDSWLILERVADRSGQTYAQVMACTDGGYLVEHRAAGRLGPGSSRSGTAATSGTRSRSGDDEERPHFIPDR